MLNNIVGIASIVSSIGVIISLSMAIAQLKKTASIAIADHSRQKKQATIEFFDKFREKSDPLRRKIRKAAHDNQITEEELNNSPHLKKYISQYLSLMERMAVGIDADVFDYEVFRALHKTLTIKYYHQLRVYIIQRRKETNSETLFIYYEKLAQQLERDKSVMLPDIRIPNP